jgi:hypothetical protein
MQRSSRLLWILLVGCLVLVGFPGGPAASASPAAAASETTGSSGNGATPPLAWSTISPPAAPPPLAYASAVYDSDNKTVVLFGGVKQDGTLSNDTWVWNGSTWTDYPAAETQAPPARRSASMAFDPGLHQLILFGGEGPGDQLLGDTWAWNGASWYQQSVPSGGSSPSARAAAPMAYTGGDDLVLFGGTGLTASGASALLGDTWLWTGNGWSAVSNLGAGGPAARSGASLAYDANQGEAVLFGGETAARRGTQYLNDMWAWTGEAWSRLTPRNSPPARQMAGMAGDDLTKGLVLFAGAGAAGDLADTWLWNGTSWSLAPTSRSANLARDGAAVAFDAASHQFLAFGGEALDGGVLGDTLAFGQAPVDLGTTPSTTTTTTARPTTGATSSPSHGVKVEAPPTQSSVTRAPTGATSGTAVRSSGLGETRRVLHRGELVRLQGGGFGADARITITFESTSTVVGEAVADATGHYVATVPVPENAKAGRHRFAATGVDPGGAVRQQLTDVMVVGVPGSSPTWRQRVVLTGAALLLPIVTWCVLSGWGRWRRRHVKRRSVA